MMASATHSAAFFMFLLDQTDRRGVPISTTAGSWPAVAILGGQNCRAAYGFRFDSASVRLRSHFAPADVFSTYQARLARG
jgi:hypothetical protein